MTTYNSTTVYDAATLTYDGNQPGLANLPVVGVFIAFDDGPYVADPDWVEVTDFVREVSIRRGRQDDLQQFPAGQASVVLDNRDRLFDPFNTASTYNGKLKPRRQIKVVGQWAGVNYPLFRGFVAGWPVEYSEGDKDSTVTIDCFDALGLLANEFAPTEWITNWARDNNAYNYYKMDEPIGVNQFAGSGASLSQPLKDYGSDAFDITLYSNYAIQKEATAPFLPSTSIDVSQINAGVTRPNTTNRSISVGGMLRPSRLDVIFTGQEGVVYRLEVIGGVYVVSITTAFTPTGRILYTTTVPPDTQPHFFVITWNNSTSTIGFYIDGVSVAGTTSTSTGSNYASFRSRQFNRGQYQYWFLLERVLSATEVSDLYQLYQNFITETASARFNRLMNETDISPTLYSVPESSTNTFSEVGVSKPLINELQTTASGEGGSVFADRNGVVVFATNNFPFGQARSNTSQVTFTDTGTGVYYDASSVRVSVDADRIANRVDVGFTGGGVATVSDAVSIAENGIAELRIGSQISTVAQAESFGSQQVTIYSQPKIRVEPFLVKGQRNPSYDWPRLLALDLLDRFTFVRTPSVGSAISKPMLLQSIEHRFTPGTWETIVNGSARYTGWFVLDSSLLDGEDVLL